VSPTVRIEQRVLAVGGRDAAEGVDRVWMRDLPRHSLPTGADSRGQQAAVRRWASTLHTVRPARAPDQNRSAVDPRGSRSARDQIRLAVHPLGSRSARDSIRSGPDLCPEFES